MSDGAPLDLHIRFTEGEDVLVSATLNETIAQVKDKIKQVCPRLQAKHLRLIYQGRVLSDGQALALCGLSNPRFPDAAIYLHCSLTDILPENSEATLQPQITPPTGFDRLREAGFSEDDIQNIRAQFHHLHGTVFNGEINEETRNLEEQWMENAGETLPDGTLQGTYKEMVWGLMLGFFLGLITLFWFRESVFTRRHQMGIIAGILINISFGILHVYY
ncbi:DUF2407 C-terminal domain-containing protein [Endogone sp. FLAS-F59071]|nr:DUF2407 C-terminal domain-containing protein [Endogone sp. FLAS-F59071]|eukprot:RUS21609.1 DUF2407 C-terminal domain-containing protein [Endogone sp. FLAS-F59071]